MARPILRGRNFSATAVLLVTILVLGIVVSGFPQLADYHEWFVHVGADERAFIHDSLNPDLGDEHEPTHSVPSEDKQVQRSRRQDSGLLEWFMLHDENDDGMLDGYELFAAFADMFQHQPESIDDEHGAEMSKTERVSLMVDHVLYDDDTDSDGRLNMAEFLAHHSF